MPIEDKTLVYGLPKPHPTNRASEDVLRLRAALDTVDMQLDKQAKDLPYVPNLIDNAWMSRASNNVPEGYSAAGLSIEAVHPYTKAFEGQYTPLAPATAVSDPAQATQATPYWFGRYNKGPRFPVWGGGLSDGFCGAVTGRILKMTATANTAPTPQHRYLLMPAARRIYANRFLFRAWIHLAKGSVAWFGYCAGYNGAKNMAVEIVNSTETQHPQGWKYVELMFESHAGMSPNNLTTCLGFRHDEDIEAYIAMPYLCAFMQPKATGLSLGE